jgi:hypothetical protein
MKAPDGLKKNPARYPNHQTIGRFSLVAQHPASAVSQCAALSASWRRFAYGFRRIPSWTLQMRRFEIVLKP